MPEYSFCESNPITAWSRLHIRPLTCAGRNYGGMADTESLCGKQVYRDLKKPVEVNGTAFDHVCLACSRLYREVMKDAG